MKTDDVRIDPRDLGTLSICAVRYSIGRKTYMPSLVCGIIKEHLAEYSENDLRVMINDIESPIWGEYGDACDERTWMETLGRLNEELKSRINAQ